MPGGLEKRRLDGVCACAPVAAPAAAAIVTAPATKSRREAVASDGAGDVGLVSVVMISSSGLMGDADGQAYPGLSGTKSGTCLAVQSRISRCSIRATCSRPATDFILRF